MCLSPPGITVQLKIMDKTLQVITDKSYILSIKRPIYTTLKLFSSLVEGHKGQVTYIHNHLVVVDRPLVGRPMEPLVSEDTPPAEGNHVEKSLEVEHEALIVFSVDVEVEYLTAQHLLLLPLWQTS